VGAPTLSRFFSLHYLLPFVLTALVFLHFYFLHNAGSSNPFTLEHREVSAGYLPLYPFFLVKDLVGLFAFALIFAYFVFFDPNALGHSDNYIEANGMVTPEHIVPEWYFLPFYAILRSIPDKTLGILAMGASLAALGTLASDSLALDRSPALAALLGGDNPRSSARRTLVHQGLVVLFAAVFVLLGFIGARPVEEPYLSAGLTLTLAYFVLLQLLLLTSLVEAPRRRR
jgi:quinol-cytochrome oxidoreductase complex cytochrome b subunit